MKWVNIKDRWYYASTLGFYRYVPDEGGNLALLRSDYRPSLMRRIGREFALARYLMLNRKVGGSNPPPATKISPP